MEDAKTKNESKLGQAHHKMNDAQEELERLGESINERFKEHQQRMQAFKERRERENALRHEKEHLRFEDQ